MKSGYVSRLRTPYSWVYRDTSRREELASLHNLQSEGPRGCRDEFGQNYSKLWCYGRGEKSPIWPVEEILDEPRTRSEHLLIISLLQPHGTQ
ncbi:hypothetical protein EYR41_009913 [Orbilia oligospora]|uniref:Uncharacterized protein n=1 Tax=Orbilia oligospora TaxID=2813651 RepID=A0A8H2DW45_ORBOL|nr:hypothetical protein EYR41_009913 [Orbilia oligospora]